MFEPDPMIVGTHCPECFHDDRGLRRTCHIRAESALARLRSTRPRYPISVLRVWPFLFHPATRNNSAISHALALTTIENRQALLAATLAILRPDLTRGMLFSKAPPERDPLITLFHLLPEDHGAALLERTGSWPGRLRQRITTSLINNRCSRALGPGRSMAAHPKTPQASHVLEATDTKSHF